jgi:hypothetical protein
MTQQESAAPSITTKKQVRKEIFEKLTGALAEYKQDLGEKKLAIHVKKASKLISRDFLRISKKKDRTKSKKQVTKKASKKPVQTNS